MRLDIKAAAKTAPAMAKSKLKTLFNYFTVYVIATGVPSSGALSASTEKETSFVSSIAPNGYSPLLVIPTKQESRQEIQPVLYSFDGSMFPENLMSIAFPLESLTTSSIPTDPS